MLAIDRVHYVGQPVAITVAESPFVAEDAADLVMLDIDKLPAVIGVEDALEANAPLLYPDWGTNILSPLGVEINELPLDPSRIWQLIAENRRGIPFVS